jgi:hypothetical protein
MAIMQFPEEVWFNILHHTDVSRDVKEFITIRSVCRMFHDLCTRIETPIDDKYERLQARTPCFARTIDYVFFKKPLIKQSKFVRRRRFIVCEDLDKRVSEERIDTLAIKSLLEKIN